MQRNELLSRIDMCPPGQPLDAELLSAVDRQIESDPQFAAKCQQLRQFDAQVRSALLDVAAPDNLAEQIMLQLAAVDPVADALVRDLETSPSARSRPVWASRRRALVAAALATAAGLVLYFALSPEEPAWTTEAIALAAREQFSADSEPLRDAATDPPPGALPMSAALVQLADVRWQEVSNFIGRSGVAYELRRNGVRAKLYVVKLRGGARSPHIEEGNLPIAPRPSSTAGSTAAVWRERDLLYVLVVQGGENEFRYFIAPVPVVA